MINAQNTHGNSSVVKWGSWDQNAIMPGEQLVLQQTLGLNWTLMAKNFYMFDEVYLKDVPKKIHVDPHLPYMYLPEADYTHFAFTLNNKL